MKLRILSLYRPEAPILRAQSIQVLQTAAALARRGHRVTVLANRQSGFQGDSRAALAAYGLDEHPEFDFQLAPMAHLGLSGLWFRSRVLEWLLRSPLDGVPVVYARDKRHIVEMLRLRSLRCFALCFEAHELDSAQAAEKGCDPGRSRDLERRVLAGSQALVANCEGTLEVIEEAHPDLLPPLRVAIHNGTDPARGCPIVPHLGRIAGYVGAPESYKDLPVLLAAARLLPEGIRLSIVGGRAGSAAYENVRREAGPNVDLCPAVPYGEVPRVLVGMDALIICLPDDLYGRKLSSPLKIWDYLATGLPIVAPDLPSIRTICGSEFHAYKAGDPESMARAIQAAVAAPPGSPRLRTWDQRAREVEEILVRIAGGQP